MLFYKKITFFLIKLLLYFKNSHEIYKNTILIFQEKWDFNGLAISRLLFLKISWEKLSNLLIIFLYHSRIFLKKIII